MNPVSVEVAAGSVVVLDGSGVRMSGEDLGVAKRYAGVEGVGDCCMPQGVRAIHSPACPAVIGRLMSWPMRSSMTFRSCSNVASRARSLPSIWPECRQCRAGAVHGRSGRSHAAERRTWHRGLPPTESRASARLD